MKPEFNMQEIDKHASYGWSRLLFIAKIVVRAMQIFKFLFMEQNTYLEKKPLTAWRCRQKAEGRRQKLKVTQFPL